MNTKKDFLKLGIICLAVFVLGVVLDVFTKSESFIGVIGFCLELIGFAVIVYWEVIKYSTIPKSSNRCILTIVYIIVGLLIYIFANMLNIIAISIFAGIFVVGNLFVLFVFIIYAIVELRFLFLNSNEQADETNEDIII